ncbi:MAG: ADP-ribosylglycohydrolase family protein [Microthrixaceae bacterium]
MVAIDNSTDRARGALLGLAVGDAVGTTLEFRSPGTFEPIDDMVGGGPFGLEAGQWTDDTSMALCLAESLVDTRRDDPADQLRRYAAWYRDGVLSSTGACFDIGGTTRRAIERFERDGSVTDATVDQEAAANGSLMRLAPVSIRYAADPEVAAERAEASSRTTHPAERPSHACRVLATMTAELIDGRAPKAVFARGRRWPTPMHPEVERVAAGSYLEREPPDIRGSGYSVDALEAACWAVAGADDFRSAVLRAANLGDDADTTAAIAGQLAGARWGSTGIPREWREVTLAPRVVELADRLFALGGGEVPHRWSHDYFLHAWWVRPGRVLAGSTPVTPTRRAPGNDSTCWWMPEFGASST